jgi:hypothetical protein
MKKTALLGLALCAGILAGCASQFGVSISGNVGGKSGSVSVDHQTNGVTAISGGYGSNSVSTVVDLPTK